MTKQQNFKRIIAKNGQIYYYKNGKRLSTKKGLKSFVKSIYSTEAPAVPLEFNKDERKYFNRVYTAKQNAANRYTFGFKPIPRAYALVLQKLYPEIDMSVKDLNKWLNPDTKKPLYPMFSDVQRAIDTASSSSQKIFEFAAELGLFKEDNKQTTIIDIADLLKDKAYNTWTVIVYKMDGEEIQGRKLAMQYLSEFETAITEAVRASNPSTGVLARFNYSPKYDFKNKTITINLQDKESDVELEETLSTLPDYVQTQETEKKKPEDKFMDVEIQLFYS
jgi:hypothetical protein